MSKKKIVYNTSQLAVIPDKYIGFLYYLLIVIASIYIIFTLIIKHAYLDIEIPLGSCHNSLRKPKVKTFPSNYSYCIQSDRSSEYIDPYECLVWDHNMIVIPPSELNSIFISTHVDISSEMNICYNLPKDEDCFQRWKTSTPVVPHYLAGIEEYTIMISHSMQAPKHFNKNKGHSNEKYSSIDINIEGHFLDSNGNVIQSFPSGERSIFTVDTLLKACNISLSNIHGRNKSRTIRSSGIIILFAIGYSNLDDLSLPVFTYTASVIPQSDYKIVDTIRLNNSHRKILNRHGIKVIFKICGAIGSFSFEQLLLQLGTGVGLLSISKFATDYIMIHVLKFRPLYKRDKYEIFESPAKEKLIEPFMSYE